MVKFHCSFIYCFGYNKRNCKAKLIGLLSSTGKEETDFHSLARSESVMDNMSSSKPISLWQKAVENRSEIVRRYMRLKIFVLILFDIIIKDIND